MRKLLLLSLLLVMLLPGQALAAKYLTAVYGGDDEEGFRIVAQNAKTFRMDFLRDGEPTGEYFLMNKQGRWLVDDTEPGQAEAMDMVELYKIAEVSPEDFINTLDTVTKTHRKFTVAGIEGFVWEIDDAVWDFKSELVLTTNKDMVLLTKGLVQFFNDFAIVTILGGNGPASLITQINASEKQEYDFLKFRGDELTSLEKVEFSRNFFQLPKNIKMAEIQ